MVVEFRNEPFTDFSKEENRRAFEEALAKVESELGREYDLIIGGERIKTEEKYHSINPSNLDQVVGYTSKGTEEHAEKAIQVAAKTFETWKKFLLKHVPGFCSKRRPFCAGKNMSSPLGWCSKLANPGRKPMPTPPKRLTLWSSTVVK